MQPALMSVSRWRARPEIVMASRSHDPNLMLVNYDERGVQVDVMRLGLEEGCKDTVDGFHRLVPQPKDQDADAAPLPQVVDLAEVLVQRDDDAQLLLRYGDDVLIWELRRGGSHDIKREGLPEKRSGLGGKVNIE